MPDGTPEWLLPAKGKKLEVLFEEVAFEDGKPVFAVSRIERPTDLND
jgi:hypothetical protein